MSRENNFDQISDVKIYMEIKNGLKRAKELEVDNILDNARSLEEVKEAVGRAIDNYESARLLFKSYIFEGKIPDDFENVFVEEDEDNEDYGS